jgi:hypothetical protein
MAAKSKSDTNVLFRRVNGRIIPIKSKKKLANAAEGVGLTVAGAAIAAGAGKGYRAAVTKSVHFSARGFKGLERAMELRANLPLGKQTLGAYAARRKGVEKLLEGSLDLLAKGKRIGRLTPGLRIGGIAAGTALAGAGIGLINRARGQKQNKSSKTQAAAAGAAIGLGAFITGAYGAAGARQALKETYTKIYPTLRNLKNAWKL